MRKQLAAAREQTDKPAIVELGRRILEAEPRDSETWELLARTQFELADYDRCTGTLNAWEKSVRPRPAVIDDLRGEVSQSAERSKSRRAILAFVHRGPSGGG